MFDEITVKKQADNISKLQEKIRLLQFDLNEEQKANTKLKYKLKEKIEVSNKVREKIEVIIRTKDYERLNEILQNLKVCEDDFK